MKIGSPEWHIWCKEVHLFFLWTDHYTAEFNEEVYTMTNKHRLMKFNQRENERVYEYKKIRGYPLPKFKRITKDIKDVFNIVR